MSFYVGNKHDYILDRDLSPTERLGRSRSQIEYMRRYLDQLENTVNHVHPEVSEENLENFAKAIDMALRAAENAVFYGESGYFPQPLVSYGWIDGCGR